MTTNPEMMIEDFSDDALAEMAEEMAAEGRRLTDMAGRARFELEKRMIERGATHLDEEHWSGVLKPGSLVHSIDDTRLILLYELLTPEQWAKVRVQPTTPPPRWDHRELNELMKLGGRIAEMIDAARTTERQRPTLKLTRKEEVA